MPIHTNALEAIHVTKQFQDGTYALHNVNLNVEVGETVVLIGESGSGKTTLLRLLNKLDKPTSGTIRIFTNSALPEDPVSLRRRLGYVQQDGGLLPHWTVAQNVGLVPTLLEWSTEDCQQQIRSVLELVNLNPNQFRDRYPSQLSGGQRQRVAIARALAGNPEIVLLDEPFGALDALTRIDVQNQFVDLKHRLKKTMVLVTHSLQEAFLLGDRIAVLKEGRLIQIGSPSELRENPSNEYVRDLIQHCPLPENT